MFCSIEKTENKTTSRFQVSLKNIFHEIGSLCVQLLSVSGTRKDFSISWNTEIQGQQQPVWPDWAIYWSLGNFLKPLATINLPKLPTLFGSYCEGVKIYHFSSKIMLGQLLYTFGDFYLLTLTRRDFNFFITLRMRMDGRIKSWIAITENCFSRKQFQSGILHSG